MKTPTLLALLMTLVVAAAAVSEAATTSANLNITVSIQPSASLTIGASTLTFQAQDPNVNPVAGALENPIPVIAKLRSKVPLTLLVMALDDLRSGDAVIPASAISWTAAGSPFVSGTMSKEVGQPAANFPSGSGSYVSSFNFFLANKATYLPGTYGTTINYTLSTP